MTVGVTLAAIVAATLSSLLFASLTYSLRDFSRIRLGDYLEKRGKSKWLEPTISVHEDLIFVTAILRLLSNLLVFVGVLHLLNYFQWHEVWRYIGAIFITGTVTVFSSVAVPHALAQHAAEAVIGSQVRVLHAARFALRPATRLMHAIDALTTTIFRFNRPVIENEAGHELQQEILSVVEEGSKEGVVDAVEREMIESVIRFRDTSVGQIMTARPEIVALPVTATLDEVRQTLEESGLSRLPIFEGSLDHVIGVLYARDLLHRIDAAVQPFNLRAALRPAFYVPETKPLTQLLADFRAQKIHLAIVLDEYGGTAGLATIEDVLEELVGDISDEHEPHMAALIKRIDEKTYEAEGRARIEDVNRTLHLTLPEDGGNETIGGLVSTIMGRIPQAGAALDQGPAKLTVLEAEPQRILRVRIEIVQTSAAAMHPEPVATGP